MTLHTYENVDQGSEEWLALRRGLVTASVMGELITPKTVQVADNDKSRGLTALLVAERITGWSDPSYFNQDMQRGHDIEPVARDWYSDRYGVKVDELGFMVREFTTDTEEPWTYRIGFSPDGLVGEAGSIEVKAPRAKAHLATHISGQVPLHHLPQIHAGLLVSDREWCDFISFYAGMPPFTKRVHREEKWDSAIREAAESFELRAEEMQNEYAAATDGIPTTERLLIDLELVI